MQPLLPLVVESAQLAEQLGAQRLLVVDLCKPEIYASQHIPGAVHLEYTQLVTAQPPVMGLLPDDARLGEVFSALGLTPDMHVVAYDDEGGAKACRLLWTLDVIGHAHSSLLNGGLRAWLAGRHPVSNTPARPGASRYQVTRSGHALADKEYILAHLQDAQVKLLDARTPGEYRGTDKRAQRGGHIPGAVNMDWTETLDMQNSGRLIAADALRARLDALGVTPDKEVVVYCQTHHRSSHTYIVLKSLGYPRLKGYPGAWSEWGNSFDTPVE
ncbi:MAG: sulfurtransferase [Proteobacteria bacterium]|nr:sulfurtransferase [Pseudomonadota bacterium]